MTDCLLETVEKSTYRQSCLLSVVLFFVLHTASPIYGQNPQQADSLEQVYQTQREDSSKAETLNLLFNAYVYNDIEKAKGYALEQLALSRQIDYRKGIAQGHNNLCGHAT